MIIKLRLDLNTSIKKYQKKKGSKVAKAFKGKCNTKAIKKHEKQYRNFLTKTQPKKEKTTT